MRILGIQEFDVELLWRDEFAPILETKDARELSESIADIGQLHEPILRCTDIDKGVYEVRTGRTRLAAHRLRGIPRIVCKVVECTDAEAQDITDHENIFRRHDPERRRQELETLLARYAAMPDEELPPEPARGTGKGRPRTRRGRENAAVAAELGTTPKNVEKSRQRAERRARLEVIPPQHHEEIEPSLLQAGLQEGTKPVEEPQEPPPPEPEPEEPPVDEAPLEDEVPGTELPPDPPIETFELEIDGEWLDQVEAVQGAIDEIAGLLQVAQSKLTRLANGDKLPVYQRALSAIRDDLKGVAHNLRQSRPAALCPWCKGQAGYQEQCTACHNVGYVDERALSTAPEDLLVSGVKAIIRVGGKRVALADLIPADQSDPLGEA